MTDREQWAIAVCVNSMRVKNQTATGVHVALLEAGFTGPEARQAVSEVMKRQHLKEAK